jgi:WD40 repeat protein
MFPALICLVPLLPPAPPRPAVDAYGDPLPAGAVARLGSIRWRYADPPEHLIWSPDGKYLLGLRGLTITVWSYPDGAIVGRFAIPKLVRDRRAKPVAWCPAPEITPDQIRFAADGRSALVYAGENQLFRVYLPDGRAERLETSADRGTALGISADGRRLLIEMPIRRADDSRWTEVRVIDRDRPERPLVWRRQAESEPGLLDWLQKRPPFIERDKVRLSPDGRLLIIGFGDKLAAVDVTIGRAQLLSGDRPDEIVFPGAGGYLLTVSNRSEVTRWAYSWPSTGSPPRIDRTARFQLKDAADAIDGLAVSPDGRRMVLVGQLDPDGGDGYSRTVTVLDGRSLRPTRTFEIRAGGHERESPGPRPVVAIGADGRTLAIASRDSDRVRFFDLTGPGEVRPQAGNATSIRALRATGSGRMLLTLGVDWAGWAWDLSRLHRSVRTPTRLGRDGMSLGNLGYEDLPRPARPRMPVRIKVIYDRDLNQLEGRLINSETLVWNGLVPVLADQPVAARPRAVPVATDRDGVLVAVVTGDEVSVRELETGEIMTTFVARGATPTEVEFIPNSNLLAAGYADGQVLLWDLWPADLPRTPPTATDWDRVWSDLAGGARATSRSRLVILAHPAAALTELSRRVRALPQPTEFEIDEWLAKLSHPRYAVREEATRQLIRHLDVTEGPVREYLRFTKSPEVEDRLRRVLDSGGGINRDAEVTRLVQVIGLLERIGTPEARRLLMRVARGGGVPAERAADALVRIQDRAEAQERSRPAPG